MSTSSLADATWRFTTDPNGPVAPAVLRSILIRVRANLKYISQEIEANPDHTLDEDPSYSVSYDSVGRRWTIDIRLSLDGKVLTQQVPFRFIRGRWRPGPPEVLVDGQRDDELDGDVEKALKKLMSQKPPNAASPGGLLGSTSGAVNAGAEYHKTTVIRV
jgi:hypothetical protein